MTTEDAHDQDDELERLLDIDAEVVIQPTQLVLILPEDWSQPTTLRIIEDDALAHRAYDVELHVAQVMGLANQLSLALTDRPLGDVDV